MLTKLLYDQWVMGRGQLNPWGFKRTLSHIWFRLYLPMFNNLSTNARKIIEKAEKQLMQERVRSINNTIQAIKDQGNLNRTKLASMVS